VSLDSKNKVLKSSDFAFSMLPIGIGSEGLLQALPRSRRYSASLQDEKGRSTIKRAPQDVRCCNCEQRLQVYGAFADIVGFRAPEHGNQVFVVCLL
jgi:hypothetical protein